MVEARWAAAKAYRRRCVLVLLLGILMGVGKRERVSEYTRVDVYMMCFRLTLLDNTAALKK